MLGIATNRRGDHEQETIHLLFLISPPQPNPCGGMARQEEMGKMGPPAAEILLNIGFRDIAKWVRADPDGIGYVLDGTNAGANRALLEIRNALYAFAQGDKVNYIGK